MTDTLTAPATLETEVKHSRFLVHAAPIADPPAALAFIESVSDTSATHNCWAYRIGDQYRSSDDGEPAGTAGRPILAAIDGQDCDQVAVVVTRWFGGTKLGAGGLVRAYGGAAAECLRRAPRQRLLPMAEAEIACAFDDLGILHATLVSHGAQKLEETFDGQGARLRIRLPADRLQALKTRLRDATRDRMALRELDPHD